MRAWASPIVLSVCGLLPFTHACSLPCPRGVEVASLNLYEDEEARGDAFPVLQLVVNDYETWQSDDQQPCAPMARSVPVYLDFGSETLTLVRSGVTRPMQGLDESMESPPDPAHAVRFQRLANGMVTAHVRGNGLDATLSLPAVPLDFEPIWWHSGSLCLGLCPRMLVHRFFFYYPAEAGGGDSRLSVCTVSPVGCTHTTVPMEAVGGGSYSARAIDMTWGRLQVYDALNIIALPLPCCVCKSHAYLAYNATSLMELPLLNRLDPRAVDVRPATPSVFAVVTADGGAGDTEGDEAAFGALHIERHDLISGILRRSRLITTTELRMVLDNVPLQQCPAVAPIAWSACALPATLTCEYDLLCCETDGYCTNTTVARCEQNQWAVMAVDVRPCPAACITEVDCDRGQSCCNWDGIVGAPAESGVCGDFCLQGMYRPASCPTSEAPVPDHCMLQPDQRHLLCSCQYRWTPGCTKPTSIEQFCVT